MPSPVVKRRHFLILKWMILSICKQSQKTQMKFVKSSIVLAFSLCLALRPCLASADYTNQLAEIKVALDDLNAAIGQDAHEILVELSALAQQTANIYQNQFHGSTYEWYSDWLMEVLNGGNSYGTRRNVLTLLEQIRDSVGGDGLNANPWWATNSAFALTFPQYAAAYPNEYPNTSTTYSFPQFMSRWSAMLSIPGPNGSQVSPSNLRRNWWNYFGSLNRTADAGHSFPYTWFDWMSDMMRSNMIATSAVDTNELSRWAIQSGADYVEDLSFDTNKVAAGHVVTNGIDDLMDEIDDTLSQQDSSDAQTLLDKFNFEGFFPSSFTGGDPTLVIFPESTIGGVHIAQVSGSIALPVSVQVWVSRACQFIYAIFFFVLVFRLVSREYTYWVSLGHVEEAA